MGELTMAGELVDWVVAAGGGGGHQVARVNDTSGAKSTSSTSWVDIDATHLSITITTEASWVLIGLVGEHQSNNASMHSYYDFTIDGVRQGQTWGLTNQWWASSGLRNIFCLMHLAQVTAGSHTFRPQWRVNTGSATFYADAAYAPAQLFVVEMK